MLLRAICTLGAVALCVIPGCTDSSDENQTPQSAAVREIVSPGDPSNAVDYLVVTPTGLADAARDFASYRQSTEGGAVGEVAIVNYATLCDSFSGASTPPLQSMLLNALSGWRRAPTYVLILGDPAVCVPDHDTTSVYSRWDNLYADPDTDGVVEFRVGRLPLRTSAQAANALTAARTFESAPRRSVLVIADDNCQGSAMDRIGHETLATELADMLDSADYAATRFNLSQYVAECMWTDTLMAQASDALRPRIDTARGLVCFYGHANEVQWTDENLVTMSNVAGIDGPAFHTVGGGHVANYNADPNFLVSLIARGTAAGALGCRSDAFASGVQRFFRTFYEELARSSGGTTVGRINQITHEREGDAYTTQSFVLLADPALRLP